MSYIVWIIFQSLSHLIFLYICQGISPVKSGFLSIVSSILSVIKYGKVKLVPDKTHGGLGGGWHSGTEWIPTGKRPHGAEVANSNI